MSEEEVKVETATEVTETEDAPTEEPTPAKKKKGKTKLFIILGVVVVVIIAAGIGFWVWHEQPSFCGAICHTPMDSYLETYEQDPDTTGVDKWGNEVSNTSAMLCVSHKADNGDTCLDCHVPQLAEQVTEGITWITGNYVYPLEERGLSELTEARGIDDDAFCLNENCHNYTRDDLVELTDYMTFNTHKAQHGTVACTECHKAHRASVNYCTQCHSEAEVPDGWLTVSESNALEQS